MSSLQESPILVCYEPDKEALSFYYLRSDGTKRLQTYLELSKLKEMGLETASYEIGKSILADFQEIRKILF